MATRIPDRLDQARSPDDVNRQPVRLSLIGDFELRHGGEVVDIAPNCQRLVGFLAVQGRAVRRSYASGTLWREASESQGRASMRSALWRLPTIGTERIVQASTTHVWLNRDVEVDLTRLAAAAVAVLDDQVAAPDMTAVARELAASRDDLLPGCYDDWVVVERESFRQLRLHALDHLGDRLLAGHRYPDALQVGLAAAAVEPLRESAHRLVVRAHLGEGNPAEAIRHYRAFARLLDKEVGTRPSPAMSALLRAA